jgi:hypothetical protein
MPPGFTALLICGAWLRLPAEAQNKLNSRRHESICENSRAARFPFALRDRWNSFAKRECERERAQNADRSGEQSAADTEQLAAGLDSWRDALRRVPNIWDLHLQRDCYPQERRSFALRFDLSIL